MLLLLLLGTVVPTHGDAAKLSKAVLIVNSVLTLCNFLLNESLENLVRLIIASQVLPETVIKKIKMK